MIIQVFDAYGSGTYQAFYNGVKYAVDYYRNNPSKRIVINYSGGGTSGSQTMEDAVIYANTYGVILIAAAGNQNGGSVIYPAAYSTSYSNVIAVSSTDHNDTFSAFSSAGPQVNVAAPGGYGGYWDGYTYRWNGSQNQGRNIYSTTPNYSFTLQYDPSYPGDPYITDITQNYGYLAGTSMAAPHVAGTVALRLSLNASLTPAQLRNTLQLSADKVPGMGGQNFTNQYGYGRTNANKAVRNLYVPQVYTTISSALNVAISGQTVFVSSGTYIESNNLTVNYGVTFQINPGVTLKMASGKKLTINGTLSAQGTSSNRITFQSSSGTWYGIELNYCSSTTLKYCTIQDASYGVYAYDTPLYVGNCTITDNYNGISYDNFSFGYVKNSTISYCYGGCGINCAQYSDPTLKPYNRIWNNTPSGVYGDDNSIPELGTTYNYGNNSIKNNYPDEVWSDNSNTVYAQYNYWGSSSPDPSVSENVVWEPYLTSDPTGGGLLKPLSDDLAVNDHFTYTADDTIGKSEFEKAYRICLSGDYAGSLVLFQELVDKYPETHTGLQSLALVNYCYQNLDNATASLNYMNQVADIYMGKEISGLAESIAVGYFVRSGNYDAAIANSQYILQVHADKNLAKYALYDLGTIYWYFLNDQRTGETYYRQLIAAYPDDDLSISALATLGEWNPGEPNPQPPLTTNQAEVKKFALDQNYPNPFNPETTIRYRLAEASHVTIKIYNLLGEEVIILVDKSLLQGNHAIQWHGNDRFGNPVANGVYWLRMQAGKFVEQRKLILLR